MPSPEQSLAKPKKPPSRTFARLPSWTEDTCDGADLEAAPVKKKKPPRKIIKVESKGATSSEDSRTLESRLSYGAGILAGVFAGSCTFAAIVLIRGDGAAAALFYSSPPPMPPPAPPPEFRLIAVKLAVVLVLVELRVLLKEKLLEIYRIEAA